MSDKITLTLQDVMVDRGKDQIPVQVPEHEIRVLRAVHGLDNIIIVDAQEGDEEEFDSSAGFELARLERKYHRNNTADPVRIAYPGGADDLTKFGFSADVGGKTARAAESQVVNHAKVAKKAKAAAKK